MEAFRKTSRVNVESLNQLNPHKVDRAQAVPDYAGGIGKRSGGCQEIAVSMQRARLRSIMRPLTFVQFTFFSARLQGNLQLFFPSG